MAVRHEWATPFSRDEVISCSMQSGRLRTSMLRILVRSDRDLEPADCIGLTARDHTAELTDAMCEAQFIAKTIDEVLHRFFPGVNGP